MLVSTVKGCGYDGQLFCDACRSCHSIFEAHSGQFFTKFDSFVVLTSVPICRDFFVDDNNDNIRINSF